MEETPPAVEAPAELPVVDIVRNEPEYEELEGQDNEPTPRDQSFSTSSISETVLSEPTRLVFSTISGGSLMRLLSDRIGIKYIAPEELLETVFFTIDIDLRTNTDVIKLVSNIAQASGAIVSWNGNQVLFSSGAVGVDGVANGYLITANVIGVDLLTVISERYGVSCALANWVVCFGSPDDIKLTFDFITQYKELVVDVPYSVIESNVDPSGVVEAMGLQDFLFVLRLSDNKYFISGSSIEMITALESALKISQLGKSCNRVYYKPVTPNVDDLVLGLTTLGTGICLQPVLVNNVLVVGIRDTSLDDFNSYVAQVDVPRPQFLLKFYIVTFSKSALAGLSVLGLDPTIPTGSFLDGVTVNFDLGNDVIIRQMSFHTNGSLQGAVTSTDRVEGSTSINDSTVLQSIDVRTVGLEVDFEGDLTSHGVSGVFSFADSSFVNDDTTQTSCNATLEVPVGFVRQLCTYTEQNKSWGVNVTDIAASFGQAQTFVYVLLDEPSLHKASEVISWMGARLK